MRQYPIYLSSKLKRVDINNLRMTEVNEDESVEEVVQRITNSPKDDGSVASFDMLVVPTCTLPSYIANNQLNALTAHRVLDKSKNFVEAAGNPDDQVYIIWDILQGKQEKEKGTVKKCGGDKKFHYLLPGVLQKPLLEHDDQTGLSVTFIVKYTARLVTWQ
ncbi:hypothetical protein COEREDRAFT_87684 [Coemansia reversa NRRL 1564]|uniref:Uncharacterized protein n=1 Tax=Coemansia reversa (strain ATCC 12441 / NRRL 1564) TaxID=763665 RepID=A0A2G5B9N3_COERN|nr:hypothetical protein COEREDRAFT_87684 [Coemansia reversa NRRL 1564]|eukprot:PIA15726.1 hypothetical protein COEREDRAFT_87684 [Coemansia reversa NRRL 1564]